jgi:hypothetical protein
MQRTVCAFTFAMLICAATYEACHAAPIAYRHSRQYIVIPLTRHYGYRLTGAHKASILGLFLEPRNAGGFGVKEPVLTA